MKITYITHACLLIEIQGIKILTDPWLKGPSWGGSLWHYPTHNYTIKKIPKPDYIFFSHGHDDHFHEETIKAFPKSWLSTKILVANFKEKWWAEAVNSKFSNVKYLDHNETYSLNDNTKLQLFINDRGEPDCSIRIFNKKNNIFFQTDNLMSFKEAQRIGKIQKIDMAFVIPFLTGVFPGFYKWDTETLISLGKQKLNQSLDYCFKMITNLKPKYVVPYACDLGYLGEKFHINLIHTHNKKDLKEKLIKKKSKIKTIIMGSEDYLKINGSIKFNVSRKDENEFEKLIRFANEIGPLQKKYLEEERKIKNPNLNNLVSIFKKNLDRNIKFADSFNFKTLISINEEDKNKKILIDFKKKKINQVITNYNKYNPNLILNIESSKVRNLLLKK